ncbi:MAG: DUF6356 family protein [Pseudomonadales bacterium]
MIKQFTNHPESVNETYFQHMFTALSFCGRFSLGALAALVHAFFPFLCEKTGSKLISEMHQSMVTHRCTSRRD